MLTALLLRMYFMAGALLTEHLDDKTPRAERSVRYKFAKYVVAMTQIAIAYIDIFWTSKLLRAISRA